MGDWGKIKNTMVDWRMTFKNSNLVDYYSASLLRHVSFLLSVTIDAQAAGEQSTLLAQTCRLGVVVSHYSPLSLLSTRSNNCALSLADNRPIKCIHTTEDIGRIPRCVSITELSNIRSLHGTKINTGYGMLQGRDYLFSFLGGCAA